MKVEYRRDSINIIPQCDQDEVYLEAMLGLYENGDTAVAERISPFGFDHSWDYLKIRKKSKADIWGRENDNNIT